MFCQCLVRKPSDKLDPVQHSEPSVHSQTVCCVRPLYLTPRASTHMQGFSSTMRRALTLKALSDSMDSRSPSKGIRSRLYCSRWMKDPSTPCSFSHCSQSRLRRGTKRMWKSLCGERPLSSLQESQAGAPQTVTQQRRLGHGVGAKGR